MVGSRHAGDGMRPDDGFPLVSSLLARGRSRRPLVGGHRGAPTRVPENTLAGFALAMEEGAELLELDVHLTRDGKLAVIHDPSTLRVTGLDHAVADLTMDELRRLDTGARTIPTHSHADVWDTAIPELGEVLALAGGRVPVNVEVKSGIETLPVLAALLHEGEVADQTIVSSFDPAVVRAAAALMPRVPVGLLLDRPVAGLVAAVRGMEATLLHLNYVYIGPALVREAHVAGIPVVAWTVNHPADMRYLAACGVDAILSDDPRLLAAHLDPAAATDLC